MAAATTTASENYGDRNSFKNITLARIFHRLLCFFIDDVRDFQVKRFSQELSHLYAEFT